ncbi:MAG: amidohydrolase family protein [Bacillota bacterium]
MVNQELFEYIKNLKIIDTHEHLPAAEDKRDRDTDVLREYLAHYFSRDLISAGLKKDDYEKVMGRELSIREKWELVEPYWDVCRNTGYGRSLDIAVNELYNIEEINGSTINKLNDKFQKTLKQDNHFEKVLKEKCNIEISLLDGEFDSDEKFFRNVVRLDHFIYPQTGDTINQVEKNSGIKISSFEDWLQACRNFLQEMLDKGAVGLKSGLAYERSLNYERVSRDQAEQAFLKILENKISPDWGNQHFTPEKKFQDYMMHYILNLANKKHLTVQIHTGLQEGSGNMLTNSEPSLLNNLFIQYPDIKFDIFHIGYPYYRVLSALAKMFPNVYIDMCWAHIISPEAARDALSEYLDSVPANKISAFGGDYVFVDGVYGHQYLARQNVALVLTQKIDQGIMNLKRAKKIAEMLFYDNPKNIFQLG